jgi:hypothetical protein
MRSRNDGPLRWALRTVVVAVSAAVIAACGIREEFHEPRISNVGDETVIVYVDTGVVTKLATIAAGTTVGLSGFNNRCTQDLMVAKTITGREVASRTEPICPDEFWTIDP